MSEIINEIILIPIGLKVVIIICLIGLALCACAWRMTNR